MTKTFEEKLEELEKLVKQLESDNVPLKEAVDLYLEDNKDFDYHKNIFLTTMEINADAI